MIYNDIYYACIKCSMKFNETDKSYIIEKFYNRNDTVIKTKEGPF